MSTAWGTDIQESSAFHNYWNKIVESESTTVKEKSLWCQWDFVFWKGQQLLVQTELFLYDAHEPHKHVIFITRIRLKHTKQLQWKKHICTSYGHSLTYHVFVFKATVACNHTDIFNK